MKRIFAAILAGILCLCLALSAAAEDQTAQFLGTWQVEMEGYGVITMTMRADSAGEASIGDQPMGAFAFLVRNNVMYSVEIGEDGTAAVESAALEIVDENTVVATEGEEKVTFIRVDAAAETEMTLDNPFIGAWIADLPDAAGFKMEYNAAGTFAFEFGETKGEWSYLVFENALLIVGDEGETELFTFVVIDENNIDVTELATGEVARFVRAAA